MTSALNNQTNVINHLTCFSLYLSLLPSPPPSLPYPALIYPTPRTHFHTCLPACHPLLSPAAFRLMQRTILAGTQKVPARRRARTAPPRSNLTYLSFIARVTSNFDKAFIIPCSLGRAEVSALYARGANEAFESTGLRTIPAAEVLAEGGSAWFAKRGLRATPSFQGALELWREHRLLGRSVGVV